MKKLPLILLLFCAISLSMCESSIPLPTPPDKEQEDNKNEEESKDEDGKDNDAEDITLNGTIISDATTLYGIITDKQSGQAIENVVVSDGFSCVKSDKNGVYQIVRHDKSTMVYLSVPAQYEIPVDAGNHPAFFKRFTLAKEERFRHDFQLELLPGGKQTQFTLLALADIQVGDIVKITFDQDGNAATVVVLESKADAPDKEEKSQETEAKDTDSTETSDDSAQTAEEEK